MRLRTSIAVLSLFVVGVACGSASPTKPGGPVITKPTLSAGAKAIPVIASSEILVGSNRFLVGLLNRNGAPIGTPHTRMDIAFFDPKGSTTKPTSTIATKFIWGLKPAVGFYEGRARFSHPGTWLAAITLSGGGFHETDQQHFSVTTHGTTPAVGKAVPASDSLTGHGKALRHITTDPHPDPRFYSTSIADAIHSHKPFVVVFATPKYCVSQLCGPMLNIAKQVSKHFPKLTFIHVEIYRLPHNGRLPADPSSLPESTAVKQWGLRSDPWTFVVDAHGRVSAKFEGTVTPGELIHAIDQVAG
ncbi:MAG: hypothetical protein QOH48_771 [Actinomycetota bacterium]|jgi:hypothetical protein|nr:hypothetical protein [Actinomycetota bacterium]